MTGDPDAASDEFDTEAAWTVEILVDLAPDDAIPGACRGSGDPAALDWLADALEVNQASRFLDLGGGIGGPAAWLRQRQGCDPVVAEPMIDAARGARTLFDLAAVAVLDQLPFAAGTFDAAWALAVLSTVDDRALTLSELHRVLAPGGHLGLHEFLRTVERLDDPPAGNDFLTLAELANALSAAGFEIVEDIGADRLDSPPADWQAAADRVKDALVERHTGEEALEESQQAEGRFAELLDDGALTVRLIHATRL
ncbi:MAG: methyltransferase domain-containing protein [Actinomycetota bacterium]|nr:methyltransferase domain-containing protein [Actinomycetota bacterium]